MKSGEGYNDVYLQEKSVPVCYRRLFRCILLL